jgi:hypothetical protein
MPEFQKTITTEQWEAMSWVRQRSNAEKPATIMQIVNGAEVLVPNPAIVHSDNDYLSARLSDVLNSYVQQKHAAQSTTPPAPTPAPAPGSTVPQTVVRKKALRAMNDKGVYSAVKNFIASIPDEKVRNEYEIELAEAQTFGRQHPFVLNAAQALAWTNQFVDELFIYADSLPDA